VQRTRTILAVGALAAAAALALPGFATAAPAPLAPAVDGAGSGGAVIIVLKDQHADLALKAQGQQRTAATRADQQSVVGDLKSDGATGITQLVSVNAVAAHASAAAVARLRANPAVSEVVPDAPVDVTPADAGPQGKPAKLNPALCPANPAKPLLEPEALGVTHAASDDPADRQEAERVATGKGVIVANDGINELAGNPNFVRADGSHVVLDAPDYTEDDSDGEYYGDASSIAGQGLVTYDFHDELPYSGLPAGCTFRILGVAPDASLVDTQQIDTPPSGAGQQQPESRIVAGIDHAVVTEHADVISESYGFRQQPGSYSVFYAANDAAVAAGVTVVVSSGDSGVSGTVSSPATDPLVIAAGATNTLRLVAQAYGYQQWTNDNITPLSSGGTTPGGKVVDVVAPGYGGEAACSPAGSDCPTNTQTEAFGGTSEACPLVAGAVADVIQAYADTHRGNKPAPALIKQIITGTAQDIGAPADQQGAGQLDVYAAVRAAQQEPGTTLKSSPLADAPALVPATSQLDVTANAGTSRQSVSLFNSSALPAVVTGTYRSLTAPAQFGKTVTEPVSAPDPSAPVPAEGATAAAPITFTVPGGLDRFSADMIFPDPANATILSFTLIDPKGKLTQISYDYGTPGRNGAIGSVPNIQHVEVAAPTPGRWTAKILWANGRAHLQSPPNVPGSYRGTISFRTTGQRYQTTPATLPTLIPGHSSKTVPLTIAMPTAPGDHPESVQFTSSTGARTSLPVARRTLIPSAGGQFSTTITSTVGRGVGQISTFDLDVPAGKSSLDVSFHTPDASPDNKFTYFLIDPTGKVATRVGTPTATGSGDVTLSAPTPAAGRWEIDVELNLTTSGKEFTQTVTGTAAYNQSPAA
jgi:hypothetical protein